MLEVVCFINPHSIKNSRTIRCINDGGGAEEVKYVGEQSRLISFWGIVPYDDPEIMS